MQKMRRKVAIDGTYKEVIWDAKNIMRKTMTFRCKVSFRINSESLFFIVTVSVIADM